MEKRYGKNEKVQREFAKISKEREGLENGSNKNRDY